MPAETKSIFEAEAHGAAMRVGMEAGQIDRGMAELENALRMAQLADLERDAAKARELFRLATSRLAGVLRRLGEGT